MAGEAAREVLMQGVVTDEFVMVNGTHIANASSLNTMRAACEFLGTESRKEFLPDVWTASC